MGSGWEEKTNDDGKVVQQLKIEAPSMTEEDQYGYTMPDRYRCDSCKAVMFHLEAALRKQHPKSRRMKDWEFTDLFDATCSFTAFEGYGIKLINGENALSGPGLPRDDTLAPGSGAIQMSSENWSKRLGEICRKIVYEKVGEEEIYEKFYKKFKAEEAGEDVSGQPGLSVDLCTKELRECTTGPQAPPKKADGTKEKKEKKKDKKDALKAKKDKKEAADKASAKGKGDASEKVDAQTFLRNMAVRHGHTSDEYVATRTPVEWEKLVVSIAGKLFNQKAEL